MTAAPQWPADAAPERRPISSLIPYARNARVHSAEQVAQLAASMKEFGVVWPALVDEGGEIIAGHGRVLAAEFNQMSDYPVIVARGWTKRQIKAYRLADNQLALNAMWDVKLLAAELGELAGLESLIGFSEQDLAALAAAVGNPGLTDPDEVIEPPPVPISQRGDLWRCGKHAVMCGDATDAADVKRLLAGTKPMLMVTDPPYGVNYDPKWRKRVRRKSTGKPVGALAVGEVINDDRPDWREAWALFPGNVAYVWHGSLLGPVTFDSLVAVGFDIRNQIIWSKQNFPIGRGDYHWRHEPCWYAVRHGKTGNWVGGRQQTTIWEIAKQVKSETGHSTQKPVECMRRPMLNNSNPGQTVYDPFVGSGTTMIAAEMEARQAYCMEIAPGYVDVTVARWQAFTGQEATLDQSGETFAAVAEARGNGNDEKSAAQ